MEIFCCQRPKFKNPWTPPNALQAFYCSCPVSSCLWVSLPSGLSLVTEINISCMKHRLLSFAALGWIRAESIAPYTSSNRMPVSLHSCTMFDRGCGVLWVNEPFLSSSSIFSWFHLSKEYLKALLDVCCQSNLAFLVLSVQGCIWWLVIADFDMFTYSRVTKFSETVFINHENNLAVIHFSCLLWYFRCICWWVHSFVLPATGSCKMLFYFIWTPKNNF